MPLTSTRKYRSNSGRTSDISTWSVSSASYPNSSTSYSPVTRRRRKARPEATFALPRAAEHLVGERRRAARRGPAAAARRRPSPKRRRRPNRPNRPSCRRCPCRLAVCAVCADVRRRPRPRPYAPRQPAPGCSAAADGPPSSPEPSGTAASGAWPPASGGWPARRAGAAGGAGLRPRARGAARPAAAAGVVSVEGDDLRVRHRLPLPAPCTWPESVMTSALPAGACPPAGRPRAPSGPGAAGPAAGCGRSRGRSPPW